MQQLLVLVHLLHLALVLRVLDRLDELAVLIQQLSGRAAGQQSGAVGESRLLGCSGDTLCPTGQSEITRV